MPITKQLPNVLCTCGMIISVVAVTFYWMETKATGVVKLNADGLAEITLVRDVMRVVDFTVCNESGRALHLVGSSEFG